MRQIFKIELIHIIMITVIVHYGNNNQYSIDLPISTKLGYMSWYLTRLIGLQPANVIYLLMGGSIIGSGPLPFNKPLSDCNIVNDRCVVSMVLRDPNIEYPDSDLYNSNRNIHWLKAHTAQTTQSTGMPENMTTFLQQIGLNINSLVDVQVTIPENEYEQYVTQLDTTPDDPCSICSRDVTDDAVALACGHAFHNSCIREWLTTSSVKCPHCNHDVRT